MACSLGAGSLVVLVVSSLVLDLKVLKRLQESDLKEVKQIRCHEFVFSVPSLFCCCCSFERSRVDL